MKRLAAATSLALALLGLGAGSAAAAEVCNNEGPSPAFCVDAGLTLSPETAARATSVDLQFTNTSPDEETQTATSQDVWADSGSLRLLPGDAPPPEVTPSEEMPDGLLIAGERPGDATPCTSSDAFAGCAAGRGTLVVRITGGTFADGFYTGTFGIERIVNVADTAGTGARAHYRATFAACVASLPLVGTQCTTADGDLSVPEPGGSGVVELTLPLRFQATVAGAVADASISSGVVHLDGRSAIANGQPTERSHVITRNPTTCGSGTTALEFQARGPKAVTIPGSFQITGCDQLADVSLTIADAPDPVVEGRRLVYTTRATNEGPATATNVTITQHVSTYATLGPLPEGCTSTGGGPIIVCEAGDLAAGVSKSFRIEIFPYPGISPERTTTAEVTTDSPDPDESNNQASERTRVVESSPVSTCVEPEDGLAAWFPGDGTVEDLAGDNDGGSLAGDASFTEGTVGRAFSLPGPGDEVLIPDAPGLNVTGDVSLDAWIRLPSAPAAGAAARTVVDKRGTAGVTYSLAVVPEAAGSARLAFRGGPGNGTQTASDVLGWEAGRWYHVAAVRSAGTITLYRDGQPAGGGGPASAAPATPDGQLRIGAGAGGAEQIAGDVDEVAIHSRALSADEIAEIHGAAAAGRCKLGRPINVATPTMSGTPVPGDELTCKPGSWEGEIERLAVVWDRAPRATTQADDPAWAPIDGANGPTYTVGSVDLGSRVRCREIATNANGSASAASNSLRVDEGVPANVVPPVVAGTPIVGRELTCDPGVWEHQPELSYQWYRGGLPIEGENRATYTVRVFDAERDDDDLTPVACKATGTNDVGSADSPLSSAVQPVRREPRAPRRCRENPSACEGSVERTSTGPAPADYRFHCTPGTWQDTGTWVDDTGAVYGGYEYQWLREGAPIPGATGENYDATADDLGLDISCESRAINPAGRSAPVGSDPVLLPLPPHSGSGAMYMTGGDNEFDPVNLLALSTEYKDAISEIAVNRLTQAVNDRTQECIAENPNPGLTDDYNRYIDEVLSAGDTCGVLVLEPDEVAITPWGAYWDPPETAVCSPGPSEEVAPDRSCPALDVAVLPIDPTNPSETLSPAEIDALEEATPERILWDVNADGRVDASCPGTAPVLRSLYRPGQWDIRAVIQGPTSAEDGNYDSARVQFPFPNAEDAPNTPSPVRANQVFACRTSFEPPPKTAPDLPCVTDATIGRVRIEGNFCPINIRAIDPADLKVDDATKALLRVFAESQPLRTQQAQSEASRAPAADRGFSPSDSYVSATGLNMASALAGTGSDTYQEATRKQLDKLDSIAAFKKLSASFALDQIYIGHDTSKVNGVQVLPQGGSSTLMVPSDAGRAVETIDAMTMASAAARTALEARGEEVPLDQPGQLTETFEDAAGAANDVLIAPNLDQLSDALKEKLNLGPFKLAGQAEVTLNDDGTVTLKARAVLPGLGVSPGGAPASTEITVLGDREGNLKLQGIALSVPSAYLFGTSLKDLFLSYNPDNGLDARGEVMLWPSGPSVAINRFKLGPSGSFDALDVDYKSGAGTGIPISGPFQVYMTKIGGGFSQSPDEFFGRSTLSVGPSPGGGCPTVGVEAEFRIHTAPPPFFARATGEGQLACVPLTNVTFEVRGDGYVSLDGGWNFDAGPIYFNANLAGRLRLPNWTVEAHGDGGIRHVLSGNVDALLSNAGLAACGRIVMPDPFADIAGGAGVRFSGGRPPLHFAEMIANLSLFAGCDIAPWRTVPAAMATRMRAGELQGGDGPLEIPAGTPAIAMSFEGAGEAPLIRLRQPDDTLLDFTDALGGKQIANAFGTVIDEEDRTVVLISEPQAGRWVAEVADDSVPIADIQVAEVYPATEVTGSVTGTGSKRVLRYDVQRIPGQEVRFVEYADDGASQTIATVDGGGEGEKSFQVSEAASTGRKVVAEVSQDGLPREQIEIAKFDAPNPKVGKPKKLDVSRRGKRAIVTWAPAKRAETYEVVVQSSDGTQELFTTENLKVTVSGVERSERLKVTVTGISAGGLRGPAAKASLR